MNHRAYMRRRLNFVLLVGVPGFFVTVAFFFLPQQLSPLQIHENGVALTLMTTRRNFGGAFQALEAAATVAGLTGVFMVLNAMKADRRLRLCGYRPMEIVGARIAHMLLVACFVSLVATLATAINFWSGRARYTPPASTATVDVQRAAIDALMSRLGMSADEVVEVQVTGRRLSAMLVAVTLGAGIYAALGVFVGALVRQPLEGSYLMFALPFTDIVIINTPIVSRALDTSWVRWTPVYHPARLLEAASYGGTLPAANIIGAFGMLLLASLVAGLAFRRLVRP